jgi:hypothetical protein
MRRAGKAGSPLRKAQSPQEEISKSDSASGKAAKSPAVEGLHGSRAKNPNFPAAG